MNRSLIASCLILCAAAPLRAEEQSSPSVTHFTLLDNVRLRLTGYVDMGFFATQGDGTAYVRDAGKALHPEFAGVVPWVFLGDPWGNPINAQGDSADLGLDRTNIARQDPIQSRGHPSFIVNLVNLGTVVSVGNDLLFETSLGFEPRQGQLGATGDRLDIDLAYVEWIPLRAIDLHLYVGKFESTVGIEYRNRKAPDRFGVTPSLIARYTTGNPTGIKARAGFFENRFVVAVGLTNGGMFTEKFAHFFNETDMNSGKSASGRVSLALPLPIAVEVGASGAVGAQDGQSSDAKVQWTAGADLRVAAGDFVFKGEFLRGHADGGGIDQSARLHVTGWYGEGTWQILPWLGVLARLDRRKADLLAFPNLYLTDLLRSTTALRFDITYNMIAKLEYLHIIEVTGPSLPDDVFTSSFILKF